MPRDIGLIVKALEEDRTITQSYLGTLLASYGIDDIEGNREKRATHLVKSALNSDNGQSTLRELLNEIYWEDSQAEHRRSLASSERLMQRLGKLFDIDDDGIPPAPLLPGSGFNFKSSATVPVKTGRDYAHISYPHSPAPSTTQGATMTDAAPAASGTGSASNRVFVVHGRDSFATEQLESFLRNAGLRIFSWNQAKLSVTSHTPTTLEIVKAGLAHSAAIVVLFTPDDLAHVKPEFEQPGDLPHETELTGQARQNVIFEAGMALAVAPEKTLLVRYGKTRKMSDIDGHNWTSLSNSFSDRKLFIEQLKKIGLDVDEHCDFTDTKHGDFPPRS